ncbi:MAG: hypothetical protein ACOC46_02850, partial [Pirellulales bacterium]
MVQALLIANAPTLFGDPYCHGWVTPAIPLILVQMVRMGGGPEADSATTLVMVRTITAFTILCAGLFLVMGMSGLGRVAVERVPIPIKSGIILGAAIAAFLHEFVEARSYLMRTPISALTCVVVSLVLMFSLPVARLRARIPLVAIIVALGLAPGFVVAMAVGHFTGEVTFDPQPGLQWPPFQEMWDQLSPFSAAVGFPTVEMFVQMIPFAIVVYIIAFGDIITGDAIVREASKYRPDEKIELNATRTHYNLSIRNALQVAVAGPFPVIHGPLWTGVHVIVAERYKQGRKAMQSFFSGTSAYYFWGIPILYFVRPVTSFLE